MQILLITLNYSPELAGIGKYSGEMAETLALKGHKVTVITAPPYYPQWRISHGYTAYRYYSEQSNGVSVHRCPLWVPKKPRLLTRLIHLLSFALSSFPVAIWRSIREHPDIVVVIQPALFCAPAAWLAARLTGARAWMHIQDFEIDAAVSLGMTKSFLLKRMISVFERTLLQRFDRVSTISDRMFERLTAKGVPKERRFLFPNWVDVTMIAPLDQPSPLRRELGFDDHQVIALYSGNIGNKQGLEIIINAAHRLLISCSQVQIVICGDGATRESLIKMAKGLNNIRFLPLQAPERLNLLLNMADIHLLIQRPNSLDYSMPSKLTGMFASGRPVIATAAPGSQIASLLVGCGILSLPENAESLADTIIQLAGDPERRSIMGQRGRMVAVNQWNKENVLTSFEDELNHELTSPYKERKFA
jgi:colanic acid biosynthesis glycosyl transferase WcaI